MHQTSAPHTSSHRNCRQSLAASGLALGGALLLYGAWLPAMAAPAPAARRYAATTVTNHSLKVLDPAIAGQLKAGGARLIADYGAFQLFETGPAALADFAGRGIEVRDEERQILLNAGAVDTTRRESGEARRRSATAFAGRQLHLVQFTGPVQPAWYDALLATGVRVVDYIPHNAYLVYGSDDALLAVQQLATKHHALRFEGAYLERDRLHPALTATKHRAHQPATAHYAIQLVADAEANATTLALLDGLKLAPFDRLKHTAQYVNIVAQLPPEVIEALAWQPDVISIRPYVVPQKFDERQNQIVAGNLSGSQPAGTGYLTWLTARGFTQEQFTESGLVVNVTDSGLDNGTPTPNHFGLYVGGNTANTSRVVYTRLEGSPHTGSTIQGCDGHGTINAHIIGGHVTASGFPHTDAAGYRYGLGVAPFVKVGSSVIFDPDSFTNPDYENLISRAYNNGARISSDSWGADNGGGYDADAQAYDALVRDAQPTGAAISAPGNQPMTIVFAAGNAGPFGRTVGTPGTGKNVITVGASENVHSHATANGGNSTSGNDGCGTPDAEANNAFDIASFSSRGPCADGRLKPDLVAPGTHVTGGVGQRVRTMSGNGTALACFKATGVCALSGGGTIGSPNNFFPLNQQWYTTSSGTSHSTPAVAGGAALVYQWFINHFGAQPSPAMVKAFLINAARYMNGVGANDTLPSINQGLGLLDLGTAFNNTPRLLRDQVPADTFTATGQRRTFTGIVASNALPMRVTLAWTDAPGSTTGSAFKNNLDLTVIAGGVTYKGNVFSGAFSTAGGNSDTRNNTESVYLPPGQTGPIVVTVTAANLNSDGIPNQAPALDQDFALVAMNFVPQALPVIAATEVQIVEESCGTGNGTVDPGETVTVNLSLQNVGLADVSNVVATLQASGGVGSPSAPQSYGTLTVGGPPVINAYTFTGNGPCGGILTTTLTLQSGTNPLSQVTIDSILGGSSIATAHRTNSASITIRDNNTAAPYPSSLVVSGTAGTLAKVTVTLVGFTHTYPADVDIVLVGPGGQRVALMGGVGGSRDVFNATLTFDDAAAGSIDGNIVSGTYQPSGSVASMTSPAPGGPYSSTLSAFNGSTANGIWSLYALDAVAMDSGSIAQGWRLALTTTEPFCCAIDQPPRLAPIASQSVVESNTLSFTVSATDPADEDPITLSMTGLPPGASFSATNGNGTFLWPNAGPIGIYTPTVFATDKDGADSESVEISVLEYEPFPTPLFVETMGNSGSTIETIAVHENAGRFDNDHLTMSGSGDVSIFTGSAGYADASGSYNIRLNALGETFIIADINAVGRTGLLLAGGVRKSTTSENGSGLMIEASSNGTSWTSLLPPGAWLPTGSGTATWHYRTNAVPDSFAVPNLRLRFRTLNAADWRLDDIMLLGFGGSPVEFPPTLPPIGNQSVYLGDTLQFPVAALPTDADTVSLVASNLPAGAAFQSTNETGLFTWTNAAPLGVYTSAFHAIDDDGASSETIWITVINPHAGTDLWINEIHYDNANIDVDEGVEIAGPAGTSLANCVLLAYNGDDGTVYASTNLSGVIDNEGCGYGAVWVPLPNLENGPPDGIALVRNGSEVLQFLSYEGTFAATRGAASGLTAIDIGVFESSQSPIGESLQRVGNGTLHTDFSWIGPTTASPGTLNVGQLMAGCGPVDADHDGIPDIWELQFFGSIGISGVDSDTDGDGFLDSAEFQAGTDPTNRASLLKATFVGPVPGTNGIVVQWQSATNRFYTLQRTQRLSDGFAGLISNLPAAPPLNTYTDLTATNFPQYYRIRLVTP